MYREIMMRIFFITSAIFVMVWICFTTDLVARKNGFFIENLFWSDSQIFTPRNSEVQAQIDEIDRQLLELDGMKRGYEARARRHDDQAQRLQFEDRAVLETRRHQELAEENREKAQKVQEEIDRLQSRKVKLLQKKAQSDF